MSAKANRASDPFAGYTPVKSAIAVVDGDVPDIPQAGRRRVKRRKRTGNLAETFKLALLGVVSAALIATIAAVTYGFIYGHSSRTADPDVATLLEPVRPLADWGRGLRAKAREVSVLKPLDHLADRCSRADESPSVVSAAVTNVVLHRRRLAEAQRFADGEDVNFKDADGASEEARKSDSSIRGFRTGGRPVRPITKGR